METLLISLTKSQKAFVEAQVAEGGFRSASEFIGQLIDQAEVHRERERINVLLQEGFESGSSTPMTREDWEALERRVWERQAKRNGPSV
jgi:antitoxin ParD1/3/4